MKQRPKLPPQIYIISKEAYLKVEDIIKIINEEYDEYFAWSILYTLGLNVEEE